MNNYQKIVSLIEEKESLQSSLEYWENNQGHAPTWVASYHSQSPSGPSMYDQYLQERENISHYKAEISRVEKELGNIPEYPQAFWNERLKEEGLPLVKPLEHYSYIDRTPKQQNKSALKRMISAGVDALTSSSRDPDTAPVGTLSDFQLEVLSEFEQVASPYAPGCRRTKPTSSDCPQTFEGGGLFN